MTTKMYKVYLSIKKRNVSFNVASSSTTPPNKLRRLPHVFAKVLELPFHSGANVSVQETSDSFRFNMAMAMSPNADNNLVRAHTIKLYPGVTKIVVKKTDGGELPSAVEEEGGGLFVRWRCRLPAGTRPELASTTYAGGELVVIVPKNHVHVEQEDEGENIVRVIVIQ